MTRYSTVKEIIDSNPKLLKYLEDEDYEQFNQEMIVIVNSIPAVTEREAIAYLTLYLEESGYLEDIIEFLGSIPTWCDFLFFEEYTIPEGVQDIEIGQFQICGLYKITLPTSLLNIYSLAFKSCAWLKEIYIPENIRYIGTKAFAYCTSLENIYIMGNPSTLTADMFEGCSKLKNIYFSKQNKLINEIIDEYTIEGVRKYFSLNSDINISLI